MLSPRLGDKVCNSVDLPPVKPLGLAGQALCVHCVKISKNDNSISRGILSFTLLSCLDRPVNLSCKSCAFFLERQPGVYCIVQRLFRTASHGGCCLQASVCPDNRIASYKPYISHPSKIPSSFLPVIDVADAGLPDSCASRGTTFEISALNSSPSHSSSSWSRSAGLSSPPTFLARSISASFWACCAISRSSVKSSALSPENSRRLIRKSRSVVLNLFTSLLYRNRPSMNWLI